MHIIYPYLHIISDDYLPHLKHIYKYKGIKQFKNDICELCRRYIPISLKDIIYKNAIIQHGKPSFLLTIDDGFKEVYEIIAPILLREGVNATFFLTSNFIDNKEMYFGHKKSLLLDQCINNSSIQSKVLSILIKYKLYNENVIASIRKINFHTKEILDIIASEINYDFNTYLSEKKPYLTSNQINYLIAKGFSIGAHSIDHPRYPFVSKDEQVRQTVESVRQIRKRFSLGYGAFAFPHSDSGVTKDVFEKIFASGIIDITFGTSGMIGDSEYRNIQRFSIEKPLWPVQFILIKERIRKFLRKIRGKTVISHK